MDEMAFEEGREVLHYQFNERRAIEALGYLIRKRMREGTNYTKLLKLLYLVDRESLIQTGHPITGDRMFSLPHGPVLSRVADWMTQRASSELFEEHFAYAGKYEIELIKDPGVASLTRRHLRILDQLAEDFCSASTAQLIDHVRELPEWSDPADGEDQQIPIDPAQILLGNGFEQRDIEVIREEIDASKTLDRVLRGLA